MYNYYSPPSVGFCLSLTGRFRFPATVGTRANGDRRLLAVHHPDRGGVLRQPGGIPHHQERHPATEDSRRPRQPVAVHVGHHRRHVLDDFVRGNARLYRYTFVERSNGNI